MQKIIIICGPTAVGKTRVGIDLAKKFNGEIISADSGQVWRGFDIGTAKETTVTQHLIDILDPTEHIDASKFVTLADAAIKDILSRGKNVFVVGGTGMYLKMLVHGFCDAPPRDLEIRKKLEDEANVLGISKLHERLQAVDGESAKILHPNDTTRIIRALEIFELTGVSVTDFRKKHGFTEKRYDALKIGLTCDREKLYRRINERVDKMIEMGLIEEVRNLLKKYDENCQPFSAVGYKETVDFIKGKMSLEDTVRLIKQNTRHFAKRQLTWFSADKEINWFELNQQKEMLELVSDFILDIRSAHIVEAVAI